LNLQMLKRIKKFAAALRLPDHSPYLSLALEQVIKLARQFKVTGSAVEIAALENGIVPERYVRNFKTLELRDQLTLLKARVCIIGLGGLGGWVVELLSRSGIGHLTLVEGDHFEESNLNRQLFCTESGLGQKKAAAAAERVRRINSSIAVTVHGEYIRAHNAAQLIGGCDVLVDCLDNLPTRFIIESAARRIGAPLVSAAVAGLSGHITTVFPDDPGLTAIYGDINGLPEKGAETALGTFPSAVTTLAALQCNEVIKILLDRPHLLRNRLLLMDLSDYTFQLLNLA
jgi:molybdopterin/thiamine biosynthesis adenylyltransferase